MSQSAAYRLATDKKAVEDAAAAVTATAASALPSGGYNAFISLLLIFVLVVLILCVDVSTVCIVRASLDQNQYVVNSVNAMLGIYLWTKLAEKLQEYYGVVVVCAQFFL